MMIRRIFVTIVAATMISGLAQAEPVKNGSAYCLASISAAADNSDPEIALKKIYEVCKQGDVIAVSSSDTAIVAQACDFSKTITTGPTLMCVLAPLRSKKGE